MIFLLDTNILSEMLKIKPDPMVLEKMEKNRLSLVTASPVWHELVFGCSRLPASKKKVEIEHYIYHIIQKTLRILPYDEKAASWHAGERARLVSSGLTPAFVDGQIAAIATINTCILVTRNTKDYEHFSDLVTENWFE